MNQSEPVFGELLKEYKPGYKLAFLFAIIVGANFIGQAANIGNRIIEMISGEPNMLGILFWGDLLSLNILRLIIASVITAFGAAIFAYLTREHRYIPYLILGILTLFLEPIVAIAMVLLVGIFSGQEIYLGGLFESFNLFNTDFYITLVVLQVVFIALAARIGQLIGLRTGYFDEKDESGTTIYGIKKRFWILTLLPINLLCSLVIVATFRIFSKTIQELFSGTYSGGLEGLFGLVTVPILGFCLSVWIIQKALEIIKDKEKTKIIKSISIIVLYFVIPIVLFYFFG